MGAAYVILGWFSVEVRELRKMILETSRSASGEVEKSEARWRAEMKEIEDRRRHDMEAVVTRLEARIIRFEEATEKDRQVAATDRANIAATMLTRHEFDRQMDKRFPERGRAGGN